MHLNSNHVNPSTSSGSSPGTTFALAPSLLRIPAAESLGTSPFRALTIPFDANAALRGDCGIRVDTGLLARMIPCAVTDCRQIYRASADDIVSPLSQYICKRHPHTVQVRTAQEYQNQLLPFIREEWSPKYEFTISGNKSYPYRFRSKNKRPESRLPLLLDIEKSPTLDKLIPLTMGTTLAGEELYCFVPPHAYERLKQACIDATSKKPKKRQAALATPESELAAVEMQKSPVGVVQRNYLSDPTVEPSEFQLAVPSGKTFLPKAAEAPEIDFPTWVSKLPASERPTPDSYKMFFGSARQVKLERHFGTQDSTLMFKLPSLRDLPRKQLFRVTAERKHLFKTVDKFLRQVAPELFKHSDSLGGPSDPRKTCPRCGGSWLDQRASYFICRDCGQYQYVGGKEEFDELKRSILTKSHGAADFGEMSEQTIRSKLLHDVGFEGSEENGLTVSTLAYRSDEPDGARMTKEEFVSVLLYNLPKYHRTRNLASRLTVLHNHFLGTSDWFLRDYATSVGVPEETAKTWVKRFKKEVEQHRAENRENLTLTAEIENRLKSLLIKKIQNEPPNSVYQGEGDEEGPHVPNTLDELLVGGA